MSSQAAGTAGDLRVLREGEARAAASGIPHADLLVAFADALVARDEPRLATLRPRLVDALGPDGLLETAAVAANFQRMVRIADATGIPQDAPVMTLAGDLVDALALRDFASAGSTPEPRLLQRLAGALLRPFAAPLMTWAARRLRTRPGGGHASDRPAR